MLRIKKAYQNFCALKTWKKMLVLFLLFFPLRFIFGIFSEFWFDDEVQIYLIGLKFYAGGHWPYFGPDVIYTSSQIPGALQGLLVGLPFYILQIPESPYILLNLLTFSSLFLLGFYLKKNCTPNVPEWFLWVWIFTAPWVMSFSTHIVNPSYVLPMAILFFISFMETIPAFRKNFFNYKLSFLFMGFSLLWIFQLHLSWVLLLPFVGIAFFYAIRKGFKNISITFLLFLAGCLISGIFVIPTFIEYGFASGSGNTSSNVVFNISNAGQIVVIIVRILSLAGFEIANFTGCNTKERIQFITENIWAAPFIIFAVVIGFMQIFWMIISWFMKNNFAEWKALKYLMLFTVLFTYISFLFSIKGPSTHTFYLMLPLAMIYSFYCWQELFTKNWIKIMAGIFLFSGIMFHVSLGMHNFKFHSMYKNRESPLNAIQKKNIYSLNRRRPFDRNN